MDVLVPLLYELSTYRGSSPDHNDTNYNFLQNLYFEIKETINTSLHKNASSYVALSWLKLEKQTKQKNKINMAVQNFLTLEKKNTILTIRMRFSGLQYM